MIKIIKNETSILGFILSTKNTTYVIGVSSSGVLLHLYYGAKITIDDLTTLMPKLENGRGTAVLMEGIKDQYLNFLNLELSTIGTGDYREHMISILGDGYTNQFLYTGFEIIKADDSGLVPSSYNEDEVLKIYCYDKVINVQVTLYYKLFVGCDVITKYVAIENMADTPLKMTRFLSSQLDFPDQNYVMMTFVGAWGAERHVNEVKLASGIYVNDSKCGSSSNTRNPLVILRRDETTEDTGECYGMNLVYSGNHKTIIDATPDGRMRVLNGVSDFCTTITLNNLFITKEVVLTYSADGLNGLSANFHNFVNNNIVRGPWKKK